MKKTAVYALTPQGARLAKSLAEGMDGDLFLPAALAETHGGKAFDRILELVADTFSSYRRHIFIAAAGIVVRAISPHILSKGKDPAVVVLDQRGKYVISLLSGHLGGANRLAHEVAALVGALPVITTATDTEELVSMDLLAGERGLAIANPEAVKTLNMALLQGKALQIFDPEDRLRLDAAERASFRILQKEAEWDPARAGVWVGWKAGNPDPHRLVLHPRALVAGIGCNRGADRQEILDLVTRVFREHSLAIQSIHCMATIEEKREEKGLLEAAENLAVPLVFIGSSTLKTVDVPNPSATVKKHMGVSSVCEAAALRISGAKKLLIPKTKSRNVTLAVALHC